MHTKLTIESRPDLLTEYGRAMAYVTSVERFFFELLLVRNTVLESRRTTLVDMTLGALVSEARKPGIDFTPEILIKIDSLNADRIVLAHSIASATTENPMRIFLYKGYEAPVELTTDYLLSIVDKSKSLLQLMVKEVGKIFENKHTSSNIQQ